MPVSTMDLGDANSPQGLVKPVLKAEPILTMPVPIQELYARLGIIGKKAIDTDGFAGGLATDAKRVEGTILVKRGANRVAASPPPTNSSDI